MVLKLFLSKFIVKGNPVFSSDPRSLPKNLPDCPILCNWIFDNFILADEPFEKDLRKLETWVLVNKIIFIIRTTNKIYERFKVTPVPFFIADFNLLSCELDSFTFNVIYWVTFILMLC